MSDDTDVGEKRPHVRLGAKIREARRRVGCTQSGLAGMLDVTRASVAQWETGRAAPGRKRRARLVAVLKSLLADLPGGAVARTERSAGRPPRTVASASVAFDADLLDELRDAGINIGAELAAHLHNLVAAARAERRWLNDDREVVADVQAFLKQHGLSSGANRQD
jgi:post-segregation antitoxin (ccd killing protein)/DNA-binding XRE family transcriptional regulator